MGFVTREGTRFVLDGKEISFSGVGIGSWLNMEHYMLGLPAMHSGILSSLEACFGPARAAQFYDDFVTAFCAEEDFAFLKESGVNLVRVPLHYGLFLDDENPGVLKEEGFRYCDRLFKIAGHYGIYVLPDLHAAPGGQNPDWHSDNGVGVPLFWQYRVFRDQAVLFWGAFAARYREEPFLLGYDLLNEPVLPKGGAPLLQEYYLRAQEAIRKEDPHHLIFLEGDHYAMDFTCLGGITDEQTALSFHYYPTVWDAQLDRPDYPRDARRRRFEEEFLPMLECMESFGRPMLCGEFGFDIAGHTLEHVTQMLDDILEVFERHDLSWVVWCYKDAQFMGMVYPSDETDWMQFTGCIHKKWNHYRESAQAEAMLGEICRYCGADLDGGIARALRFRQEAVLSEAQRHLLLEPLLAAWGWERVRTLPQSFSLKNCAFHREYRDLILRHSRTARQGVDKSSACSRHCLSLE